MTNRGDYREGGEGPAESDDKRLDSNEQIEAVGRAYFAGEFPNPSRAECPRPLDLVAAVRAGRLPDESLRAHLMSCSECFNDFREARRAAVTAKGAAGWRRVWAAQGGLRVAAIAAAALLVTFIVIAWVMLRSASQATEPADQAGASPVEDASRAPASRAAVDTPSHENVAATNANSSSPANRPGTQSATVVARITLDDYPVLRGANGDAVQGSKIITLARRHYDLTLRLPEGSAGGQYRVSLKDEFGATKTSAVATSGAGGALRVALDLSRLPLATYILSLARRQERGEEEAPRYYRVRLIEAGSAASNSSATAPQ